MQKPITRHALVQACAAAALLAIAPSYAPAQNGGQTQNGSQAQPAQPAPQTPEVRTRPLALPGLGTGQQPATQVRPEPLPGETDPTVIERVGLDELSLSAIVVAVNPDNNIAMLEHDGIGYLVHKGSKIGSKNGVVREISATTVVVEEPAPEPGGGPNVVELTLPR
ncbi:MAG: hypothetical protein LBT40_14675 [Deltaproteobacteria bacterium]|jgi:Tfp pilus assembly protein PilP|nr:hypothetical protein [Deltaproteobacteria bacterium]